MSKKTINLLEFNTGVELAYKARKVHHYVYQPVIDLPDQEARDQLANSARELLTRGPEPGEDLSIIRANGERMLFALAQVQIEELESTEAKHNKSGSKVQSAVIRPAWLSIQKARESSYLSATGRPLRPWSFAPKNPGFTKARIDLQFQAFMLKVGIKRGKVTPTLRKASKVAMAEEMRQGSELNTGTGGRLC